MPAGAYLKCFKLGDQLDLGKNGCESPCIYSPENDDSKEFCFGQGSMESECLTDVYQSPIPCKLKQALHMFFD